MRLRILAIIMMALVLETLVSCDGKLIEENVEGFEAELSSEDIEFFEEFSAENVVGRKVVFENVDTAIDVAKSVEEIWFEVYGEKEIKIQRPYKVSYNSTNELWIIKGNAAYLGETVLGGVVHAVVSKETGELIALWHDS